MVEREDSYEFRPVTEEDRIGLDVTHREDRVAATVVEVGA